MNNDMSLLNETIDEGELKSYRASVNDFVEPENNKGSIRVLIIRDNDFTEE